MQAIILAAGMGKRLGELTQANTKCMVKVNGIPLIDRMLTELARLNLSRVVIVTGYFAQNLVDYIGNRYDDKLNIVYVNNPIYNTTNNIYSLALAKDFLLEEDTLLLESDLIFDGAILDKLIDSSHPNVALVAKYESWMDGTMVTLDKDLNIVNFIPKKAFKYENISTYYKTVNIYKFSREFLANHYVPLLEAYCRVMGNNEYYEQVLRIVTFLDRVDLKALPVGNRKWYEIDDIQDLDAAETIFSSPAERIKRLNRRYGGYWRFPKVLDFCYLVNPYFPPDEMKAELRANFDTLMCEYPSGMSVNSMLAARYFEVKQEYICPGNGAAELIKSLMTGHCGGRVGVVLPTFEEYPNRLPADRCVAYVADNPDFRYTAQDLKDFFADKLGQQPSANAALITAADTLLIVNPDNPSGNFIPKSDLLELADWCYERGIRLVVDESFVDFSDGAEENSLIVDALLEEHTNLVVVKSISKSYGVPGLRLGVIASADTALIASIRRDVAIWNINSMAEFYMQIYPKYRQAYKKACELHAAERARLFNALSEVKDLRVIPSQANYFLCELTGRGNAARLAESLLAQSDILVKNCSTKKGFDGRQYVRISVRNREDNNQLIAALTKKKVCICGGGALGHALAGMLADNKNLIVSVLTRRPDKWDSNITVASEDGSRKICSHIAKVSDNPDEVVLDADVVLLCLPGFAIEPELQAIKRSLKPGAFVGSVFCGTGFFTLAQKILPQDVALWGFQRVPVEARVIDYGHSVRLLGRKRSLSIAVERAENPQAFADMIAAWFGVPVKLLNNAFEASLTNSNPLLHTARLYSIFKDYAPGVTYDCNPLFYEEWSMSASETYIAMDAELFELIGRLPVDPDFLKPVLQHYESCNCEELTAKLRSIFKDQRLYSPMVKNADGRFVPDLQSRYFVEDFEYGLKPILDLADQYGVPAPTMHHLYTWYLTFKNL